MAEKKIKFELDVNGKPIDVAIDKTIGLKNEFRLLSKEVLTSGKYTDEQMKLISKRLGDVKDQMESSKAKSKDLFGSLSLLPGPVGAFAGSVDTAIGTLKTFTSFSFKDLTFQLKETINDFKDVGNNILKASGIKKVYTTVTKALTVAEGQASIATKVLAASVATLYAALGVGLILALVEVGKALYDMVSGEKAAKEASDKLNASLDQQQKIAELNAQAISRRNKERIAELKAQGATEQQIRNENIKQAKDALAQAQKDEQQARDNYNKNYKKANNEDKTRLAKALDDKKKLTLDAASNLRIAELDNQAAILSDRKAADQKVVSQNQKTKEEIKKDNETADQALIDLQRENAVLSLKTEREREDKELQNTKQAEIDKINVLKIEDKRKKEIIDQINTKYDYKQKDVNNKRKVEDEKAAKEIADKIEDIRISAITDEQEKEKAQLQKGYDETKAILDKALADKLIKQEDYNKAILNLDKALAAAKAKVTDDSNAKDRQKDLDKLDADLKFLQIRGQALTEGTSSYFKNLRDISKKSEERELKDLEDRAIKEKWSAEKLAQAKKDIKEKYAKENAQIDKKEFDTYLGYATATLSAVSNVFSQMSEINQMQMDLDLQKVKGNKEEEEKIKKEYFEKNKKTQIAQAIIGTLQAAVQAYQSLAVIPVVGPALGAAAAAAALIFGYKKVNLIKQQQYQSSTEGGQESKPAISNYGRNYGDGGMIDGPRHAQGGVMINAEGGEAVMSRGSVAMFAPLLSALNQIGGGTSFTKGAIGQARPDNPKRTDTQEPIIMKTYVVENELTTLQYKQARLKDLSTL